MPIPQNTVKLIPYGFIGASQGWSTTISLDMTLVSTSWDLNSFSGYAAAVRPLFDTWWTACKALNASIVDYRGIKAFFYGSTSGKVTSSALAATGPVPGSGASNYHPSYTSLVASMRTAFPGRQGRGRSYLPITAVSLQSSDLQAALGTCNTVQSAYLALVNSLNAYTSTTFNVTSQRVSVTSAVSSANRPVTSIIVNSVCDTQHRREDKLQPSSQSTGIVT